MMCADAGLHADQARRQVGEPGFHLATRPLLPQHQGSTAILADQMERVLADIDADDGDFATEFLGHGVLLCPRCPSPVWPIGRAGARPDHPISRHRQSNCFALRNLYSITSSARSKIDCGTVRPSALAVLRLTTISNFVGNCTGRSPAFAPLKMRST